MSGWLTRTGLVGTDAGGRLVSVRAALRVTRGPDAGASIELEAGSACIGSHKSCELRVNDPAVSRRHVELLLLSGGVRVRDLGSKNGTFISGARVEDATMPLPFELRIGSTHVEVRSADVPLPEHVSQHAQFGAMVGESLAMRRVFGVLERVAATDVPISFSGEPGTGKTFACQAVHAASGRSGPLLFLDPSRAIDAAVIDTALVAAHGGTLILERIDEWPRRASEAMIAAIDARERTGTRILATAEGDLRAAVQEERVPRALFFFIAGVHVTLPPIRERMEDVPLLIAAIAHQLGYDVRPSIPETGRGLSGNVRELRSLVEAWVARHAPPRAPSVAGAEHAASGLAYHEAKEQLLHEFERRYLADLMARHDGVIVRAAEEAGLGRNHLARLLKKHDL
jgi:DNA-binding NtrC family response regulator